MFTVSVLGLKAVCLSVKAGIRIQLDPTLEQRTIAGSDRQEMPDPDQDPTLL